MAGYSPGRSCSVLHSLTLIRDMICLGTFRTPCFWALISAIFAAGLEAFENYGDLSFGEDHMGTFQSSRFDAGAYSLSSGAIAFLMVFRMSQAYARHWEGVTFIHRITGSWFDGTSSLFAFCRGSKAPEAAVEAFKGCVVRLVSLCNAMIFAELEGTDANIEARSFEYNLIDAGGLDYMTLRIVAMSKHKPEVIFQMLQNLTVKGMQDGIIVAAPPVVAQAFSDFAGVMVNYHEAVKLQTPYPFAYACITEGLLVMHIFMTPLVVMNWVSSSFMASVVTFSAVFTMCALNSIALELDNPFRSITHDFDGGEIQQVLNKEILALLTIPADHHPRLNETAKNLTQYLVKGLHAPAGQRGSGRTGRRVSEVARDVKDEFVSITRSEIIRSSLVEAPTVDSPPTSPSSYDARPVLSTEGAIDNQADPTKQGTRNDTGSCVFDAPAVMDSFEGANPHKALQPIATTLQVTSSKRCKAVGHIPQARQATTDCMPGHLEGSPENSVPTQPAHEGLDCV